MKKILAFVLALVMAFGLFAGCGSTAQEPADSTTPAADAPEVGGEAGEEELPTLTVGLMKRPTVEDFDTNYMTLLLEEKLGCNLEFVYFSTDLNEALTQLALMVSGGEKLPDVIWNMQGVDIGTVNEYGMDGYFLDLTNFLTEENAPNFFEGLQHVPEVDRDKILSYGKCPADGAIYAIPYYAEVTKNGPMAHVAINQKWLDTLNLQAPTTIDELYDVLVAFKNQDPNGNGKADEIPAIGYSGYRGDLVQFIINSFVYCNDDYFFNATDGKVWAPYNTDEYRQALIFINKLVSEGLLDPAGFSIPASAADGEMVPYYTPADGVAITGIVGGHCQLTTEADNEVFYEYKALAPLKGVTDKGGFAPWYASTFNYDSFITADCENVELAYKFFNELYSPEMALTMQYGEQGSEWEFVTEGESALGIPANIRVIDGSLWQNQSNKMWQSMSATIGDAKTFADVYVDDGSFSAHIQDMLRDVYTKYNSVDRPAEVVAKLTYNEEENEVYSEVSQILTDYVKESRALFATGAMDPNNDADWQAYCDALEGQGMSKWVECAQAAYSRIG